MVAAAEAPAASRAPARVLAAGAVPAAEAHGEAEMERLEQLEGPLTNLSEELTAIERDLQAVMDQALSTDVPHFAEGCGLVGHSDVYAATGDAGGAPSKIQSVKSAMLDPAWDVPGGWREAVAKDLKRILEETFPGRDEPTVAYVPESMYLELRRRLGATKVQLKYFVVVCRVKYHPDGTIEKRSARATVADTSQGSKVDSTVRTFAGCVYPEYVRVFSQAAAQSPHGRVSSDDVPGAYYNGDPPDPESPEGRYVFVNIPSEWGQFGYPQRHPATGQKMLMLVKGNLPGLQDAGRTWSSCYTKFMLEEAGMVQSIVDRRVFYLVKEAELKFAVAVHVDDNFNLILDEDVYSDFHHLWSKRFGAKALGAGRPSLVFYTGIRIRLAPGEIKHDSPRLMDSLAQRLEGVDLDAIPDSAPLPLRGLAGLRELPTSANPLVNAKERKLARGVLGLAGYIVCQIRPDGQLAFIALSQQIANNCTKFVLQRVLQLAKYLLRTRDMCLVFRRVGEGPHIAVEGWSDSSALNGGGGVSWGGGCVGVPGSGLLSWKCLAPKKPTDSSGAAELVAATYSLKSVQGMRVFLKELRLRPLDPEVPTPFNLDATATLSGVEMEKVSEGMRYVAARLAMLRYGVEIGDIVNQKCPTEDNKADGFTKELTGAKLAKSNELMLGDAGGGESE